MGSEALAKKIAELLDADRPAADLTEIKERIDELGVRLSRLEAANEVSHSSLSTSHSVHPSLDKLSIAEAIADQIFGGEGKEKACSFEPNGKPCDHCSMCSSRGF